MGCLFISIFMLYLAFYSSGLKSWIRKTSVGMYGITEHRSIYHSVACGMFLGNVKGK